MQEHRRCGELDGGVGCGTRVKGHRMAEKSRVGLRKEEIRRIVLSKLRIVYRDWRPQERSFLAQGTEGGTAAE
jgi:hypothetical protein